MFLPYFTDVLCIIHHSRSAGCMRQIYHLQAYVCQMGIESYPSIGNHFILMFMEARCSHLAQQVFERLAHPDRNSWSLLIIGYVKLGESHLSLIVYRKMKQDGSKRPTEHAFVALLKACTDCKDVGMGCKMHGDVVEEIALENGSFVYSALVHMYAKCGLLTKAQEVFNSLPVHDVVSWNSLICGYTDNGYGIEALSCLEKMQQEGVPPSAVTILCSLTACGSLKDVANGEKLHAAIVMQGLEGDLMVCNNLVDMYAKCGCLATAQTVFNKISCRDVVSWNVLISGYVEHELPIEGLFCYEKMLGKSIVADDVTFLCCLKACSLLGDMQKGLDIHWKITCAGLEAHNLIGNTLVDMYIKCGSLESAEEVFDHLPFQDSVLWNVLIAGYVDHGYSDEALQGFDMMQADSVSPTTVTFVCCLKACSCIEGVMQGKTVHLDIVKRGLDREVVVGSTLIHMYATCSHLAEASAVLIMLPIRTVVSWNALIAGYVKHGCDKEALECLKEMKIEELAPDVTTVICALKACGHTDSIMKSRELHALIMKMGLDNESLVCNALVDVYAKCGSLIDAYEVLSKLPVRDVVSWSSLLVGYIEFNLNEQVLYLLEDIQNDGVHPNSVLYVCLLKVCGKNGVALKGRQLHDEIAKKGLENELRIGNMLVDMYVNCGSLMDAESVFEGLLVRDQVTWNVLIAGYAQLGESEKVIYVYDKISEKGIRVTEVTLISILHACSHGGLLETGLIFFGVINSSFDLIPNLKHYTCLVDLFGRAGLLDWALEVINNMPLHPDIAVWLILLGACRKWNCVESGSYAFKQAVELYENDSTAYICMSNVYMNASVQGEVYEVQDQELQAGWKSLCSWLGRVEADGHKSWW